MEEKVLVLSKKDLEIVLNFEFDNKFKDELYNLIIDKHEFMPRESAEFNYDFLQIIPYVVLVSKDSIFFLKRTKKQTEKRLHNMYSIGIGGHINPSESCIDIIYDGLFRELYEEINIKDHYSPIYCGLINDSTADVSKVHLGLTFLIFVDEQDKENITINEKNKMTGEWVTFDRIRNEYINMESWSQIVWNNLFQNNLFSEIYKKFLKVNFKTNDNIPIQEIFLTALSNLNTLDLDSNSIKIKDTFICRDDKNIKFDQIISKESIENLNLNIFELESDKILKDDFFTTLKQKLTLGNLMIVDIPEFNSNECINTSNLESSLLVNIDNDSVTLFNIGKKLSGFTNVNASDFYHSIICKDRLIFFIGL